MSRSPIANGTLLSLSLDEVVAEGIMIHSPCLPLGDSEISDQIIKKGITFRSLTLADGESREEQAKNND